MSFHHREIGGTNYLEVPSKIAVSRVSRKVSLAFRVMFTMAVGTVQLQVVSCQLPAKSGEWGGNSCRLPAVSCRLSGKGGEWRLVRRKLSVVSFQWPVDEGQRLAVGG
jgi:hypothetical protein